MRRKTLSLLCHGLAKRSFKFSGEKMLVCSRCFGVYAGFLVTSATLFLLYGAFNADVSFFLAALLFLAPMALDGATQLVGKRESTNTIRFVTGYLGGLCIAFFAYASLSKVLEKILVTKLPTPAAMITLLPIPLFLFLSQKESTNIKKLFDGITILSIILILGSVATILFYTLSTAL